MELGLTGKVAVVTGATSGLGLETAKALAAEGATLAICGRNSDRLTAAVEVLEGVAGAPVLSRALDVTDTDAAVDWITNIAGELGAVHILVTNSAGPPAGPVTGHDLGTIRSAFDRVTLPAIALSQAAIPSMKAAGWGRLLFVTSETVRQPIPKYGLSGVTRLAIVGYVLSMVEELGTHGITANILAPGYHRTPALMRQFTDEGLEDGLAAIAANIPMGRLGEGEDFGKVATFLASEPAGFITGTIQLVDGGLSRGV